MSTAKMFGPANLMMVLATVVLGVQTSFAEPAADDCKTTPGSSAPPGQHWFYRVNRSDQRHCWYLGAEGTKVRSQTREKASSPPARTAREEASETTPTVPPPMEVIQTPSVPAASSEAPAVTAELARPSLDFPQAPDPTAREPAATNTGSAPEATDAEEEMPLVWPVLTEAERAGLRDGVYESAPWSVILIAGGALLVAGSLFKLAWRARFHPSRHAQLRHPRSRQQRRPRSAHPSAPPRPSARKSALPTRRDARPRARPTSAAPLQVPNPRELARDARQGG